MIFRAIIDGIINWKGESNFNFIGTQSSSLKGSFIMYLILVFIAFVLSKIFEKAVEIKNKYPNIIKVVTPKDMEVCMGRIFSYAL